MATFNEERIQEYLQAIELMGSFETEFEFFVPGAVVSKASRASLGWTDESVLSPRGCGRSTTTCSPL